MNQAVYGCPHPLIEKLTAEGEPWTVSSEDYKDLRYNYDISKLELMNVGMRIYAKICSLEEIFS
jgi:hypothetical protein